MSVYFIRDETGLVKIGHARDPRQRLRDLQIASPSELDIVRIVPGGQKIEAWLHRRFADQHVRGEWFYFVDEMMTVVPPDELPPPPKRTAAQPRQSVAESIREAHGLGLLSERMQREFAPFLQDGA